MEDEDSEIFLMSLPSIDTQYVNIDLLKQVYDGLLQKWFSIKGHRETIEESSSSIRSYTDKNG